MKMRSIKSQLTTTLLLCLLLPSGLIGLLAYCVMYDAIKSDLTVDAGIIAAARYESLKSKLQNDHNRSKDLLNTLVNACQSGDQGINACIKPFLEEFAATQQTAGIVFHSGIENDLALGIEISTREELNKPYLPDQIASIAISRLTSAPYYSLKNTDSLAGFQLFTIYPAQNLQDIFSGPTLHGESGETFLTDNQGLFVTKPRYVSMEAKISPITTMPMQQCLHHESGEMLDVDYRNVPVVHGFRYIPEIGGGCIMAHIDQAEAFAPMRQLSLDLSLGIYFIALSVWLIASKMGKNITKPIIALGNMARALSKGDFAQRIPVTNFTEIAELSRLFNTMANQLRDNFGRLTVSKQQLGKKVIACSTELYQQQLTYYSVIQTTAEGFWRVDMNGYLTEVNPAYADLSGYDESELIGMHISDLEAKETSEVTAQHIHKIKQQGSDAFETRHRRKNGTEWDVEVNTSYINEEGGYFVAFLKDISERKRTEQELRIAATAFETQEGIMITDSNRIIVRVNHSFTRITGYPAEEVIGKKASILMSGRHEQTFYASILNSLKDHGFWAGEIWDQHKDGRIYPQWLSMTAVKDNEGIITHYVSNFSDITDRKASEEEIRSLAFYDALTALPNRRLLTERLEHTIVINTRTQHYGALLFLDLDNFKLLNDTQGHGAGDELLIEVASRLKASVRKADTVARLGGDEFIILMEKFDQSKEQVAIKVKNVAEKIITSLAKPYHLSAVVHNCSSSMGIVLFNGADKTAETILAQADTAMYAAKKNGKNTYRFFDPYMQKELEQRAEFEFALRQAVDNKQYQLLFQPQVNQTGQMIGAEALIRWQHPELDIIAPAQFIPLAEETGIILTIGHWVLETACLQLQAWQKASSTQSLSIAVNISAKQLYQPGFVNEVRDVVAKYAIDPSLLKLELTERMILEKIDMTVGKLLNLKAIGVQLVMDDFGTGYSSLSFLRTLPFDQVKIDKTLVEGIQENSADAFLVSTVLNLGELIGIEVIAEGVERHEQLNLLKSMGCKLFQGYLFGQPCGADALPKRVV
jgi:diguanylate cyclase (GGDEF)-like protein/PAS domain S-box-containing protein